MKHKALVVAAAALGLWIVGRTTNAGSYARTLWSQVRVEAKKQISTGFELERARHEVQMLDKDIAAAVRPIAEYKAALQSLDKDIRLGQSTLAGRRDGLLKLTQELDTKANVVLINNKMIPYEKARAALDREFESFQRLEKHVASLHKLHEAKQNSLDAAQEQLTKLIAKKREFEVRLAQLETDEETLKIAGLGNKMAVDDNRASAIENALADIEHRQNVRRAELELTSSDLVTEALAPARATPTDLASMKAHLERKDAQP